MTAPAPQSQPDTSDGLTNIERVRMALAISDAGYSWELDQEYAEDLLTAYDAQTARIEELTKALKATREQLIKVRDASPEIRNHELETNQVIAQAWHTLNDTGVATPLEDQK